MWLLVVQGLIANAYISARSQHGDQVPVLAILAILVTLSAFVLLYKSYQARGYLTFLGQPAKRGLLAEPQLPLIGWPDVRIRSWRRGQWLCRWLNRPSDLLEPYFFLRGPKTLSCIGAK